MWDYGLLLDWAEDDTLPDWPDPAGVLPEHVYTRILSWASAMDRFYSEMDLDAPPPVPPEVDKALESEYADLRNELQQMGYPVVSTGDRWPFGRQLEIPEEPIIRREARSMTEDDFWQLIAGANARGKLNYLRLGKKLERLPIEAIRGFDDQLRDCISALSAARYLKALQSNLEVEQPISHDGYEYLLAGVVSRGRKVFEEVRRDASLLRTGHWFESEELLYLAEDVIDSREDSPHPGGSTYEVRTSSVLVFNERYPVAPAKLEEEFPVQSFGWILVDVQDAGLPAVEVFMHDEGSFTVYPESDSDFVRSAFQGPAVTACAKLRTHIDFRMIPGLVLIISITIGDQTYGPEIRPICSRIGPFDLRPGVAIGIDRSSLPESNSPEFEQFGASVVVDALAKYFEGQARELAYISRLRSS
jgi:hypothetical protein